MRQNSGPQSAEKHVKEIRRRTRRKFSAEEKIRIVLAGLRGEASIAELCRREGLPIRTWTVKFGARIADNLRRRKLPPSPRWHLDEMVSMIAGERVWIWRATVIQHAVWLYFRFTLSLRDIEEMMAHRGVDVSYETIRAWTVTFGPKIAANLRRCKLPPSPRWHLDEMVSMIAGERVWIWRAVDDEGEVMDMIVQKRRDAGAALRFLRRGC